MADYTRENFIIYDNEFHSGIIEAEARNLNGFNAASNNTIRLQSMMSRGDFEKEAFYKKLDGVIQRRDVTSDSDVTALFLEQAEHVGIKIYRRSGPLRFTIDEFHTIMQDPSAGSVYFGQAIAEQKIKDQIDLALLSIQRSISGIAAVNYDYSGTGAIAFAAINNALKKFGDRAMALNTIFMHSTPYFDLIADGLDNYIVDTVAGASIVRGAAFAMGRTVIVMDSPSLTHNTLAYDGQTSNFTVGNYIVGDTSGARGDIVADVDAGATGTLTLTNVDGIFEDDETLSEFEQDGTPATGDGTVNGTLTTKYVTLLLQQDAAKISDTKITTPWINRIMGKENLGYILQGELEYLVKIKGVSTGLTSISKYDDVKLGIASNWSQIVTSHKNLPGVRLLTT